MKYFILFFIFVMSSAFGATCTTTTRSNYSNGQKLTSTALNADFNQLVTKVNSLDGGCVTDGTLEATAFDSSLDAVKNGIHQGCALSYVDANTVQVSKCILSVNGTFVKTTATNNVSWGCTSCSSEVVSTQYYVYAKTGSSGTSLNLLISTTAPGADGYDGSGNKVLGRFYNNSSSAIDQYSIDSWNVLGFSQTDGINSTPGLSSGNPVIFSFSYADTNAGTVCATATCSYLDQMGNAVTSVTRSGTGSYTINFSRSYTKIKCAGSVYASSGANTPAIANPVRNNDASSASLSTFTPASGFAQIDTFGTFLCEGY